MKRGLILSAVAVFVMMLMLDGSLQGGDKDKPKYTIKEVMKEAHSKNGLLKKIQAGTSEKADREKLAELYKSLVQSTPPKGDAEAWKKATEVLHKLAVAAIADPDAGKKIKVDCGACHKTFK